MHVTALGTIHIPSPPCFGTDLDFNVTATSSVSPMIRKAGGQSVLRAPSTEPTVTNNATAVQLGCVVWDAILRTIRAIFSNPFGEATLTVVSGCRDVLGAPVEFEPSPGDRFYGTNVSTDGLFLIGGRSQLIDSLRTSRPPVPDC